MSVYHISLYFDEKTTAHMQGLIEKVAHATGNKYMLEASVPPHITLCALECAEEEALKERLESVFGNVQGKEELICGALTGRVSADGVQGEVEQVGKAKSGTLQWVSIGTFLPGVIFLQPVLNEYLQGLMEQVHRCVRDSAEDAPGCTRELAGVKVKPCYKPFSWLPHSTVAKKLTARELQMAFEVLQKAFAVFEGKVVRIGLAKMNPHREIANWELP